MSYLPCSWLHLLEKCLRDRAVRRAIKRTFIGESEIDGLGTAKTKGSASGPAAAYPAPAGDARLLEPGWAGELAPDELEYLLAELHQDKQLAFKWGFRPGAKRRPEWAIRQVAMWGEPDSRRSNVALARTPRPLRLPAVIRFSEVESRAILRIARLLLDAGPITPLGVQTQSPLCL